MALLKELLLLFFAGMGMQWVMYDVLKWIDPELVARKEPGYLLVAGLVVLHGIFKHLKLREAPQPGNKKTTE